MNVSDSERVSTLLESEGFEITADESSADIVLLNTCSVREKAEHKLYTRVGQIKPGGRGDKIVGVMGCVAQLEGETLFEKDRGIDFVVGTRAVGRVHKAIRQAVSGNAKVIDLKDREDDYDWTVADKSRHSPYVAFLPIIEGCNKFCTYCIVPFSRGREKSLPASEIVRQVLELRRTGVKEVHLIGQNVNSYRPGTESGLEEFRGATPFSRLLRAVAATGIERIKFTTSFPRDFHPDIVDALDEYENLCNWVHLPVQSGSDRILRAMRRGHTVESYMQRIERIRRSPREIAITTDIIVGFPGETDEDFRGTKELVRDCGYDAAYIFKYSPRPGTPAAELEDDVSDETKKTRFLELEEIQKENLARSLSNAVGKVYNVLAEKTSERDGGHLSGHTSCHKVVNFPGNGAAPGEICRVKITEAKSNTLFGERV
ncbi:MAG: tRNA (N6-isopentenyl adenosine(37)-C2)-methylthiotransferase MiaB [Aridibacter famidurans]|nr:tRNA (N6-isopentenyl adenosine(37)-C2)-methylthiotransferase MiaB [Aridibacter famidurans]